MLAGNLLHPLKLDVVGFKEEDHDYHFRVVRFGKDDQAYRDVPIRNDKGNRLRGSLRNPR